MFKPGWKRDLHISGSKFIEHRGKILVTERACYLACIDPKTGELIWQFKIYNAYGWLTTYEDKVYHLGQDGKLEVIDFNTGKCLMTHLFDFAYLGYAIIRDKYLITGGWRGYTDLTCFNLESKFSIVWKKETKTKKLNSYSIPHFLNDFAILSDNTKKEIRSFDLKSGIEKWSLKLPDNIGSLDLDHSFQIDKGRIIVYSKTGKIYSLDEQSLRWDIEVNHSKGIQTIKPKILESQYLFQDTDNYICSYDKDESKLLWKIYSNHKQPFIPAIEIADDITLIGITMKRKLMLNKEGKIIEELDSERRYASDLFKINEDIYYLSKSELKQLILR